MFRIPLDMPQGSVRETFSALISKFISRLNSLVLYNDTKKHDTFVFEVRNGLSAVEKVSMKEKLSYG